MIPWTETNEEVFSDGQARSDGHECLSWGKSMLSASEYVTESALRLER